eukprot:CAMPEP_0117500026 /NCGR_PEP_ID=MMETSP0784-20121206/22556_1 /TAXON_ID=39447 /ORGANISM="" /LENGTH=64 /DNA_ID=CAMNT_0005295207 /DNA_START=81 /DNA_END=272 /DNA_ORIENTATION=-
MKPQMRIPQHALGVSGLLLRNVLGAKSIAPRSSTSAFRSRSSAFGNVLVGAFDVPERTSGMQQA